MNIDIIVHKKDKKLQKLIIYYKRTFAMAITIISLGYLNLSTFYYYVKLF